MSFRRFIISLTAASLIGVSAFAAPQGTVPAVKFLGSDWMESPVHRVAAYAQNDDHINTYKIETPHGTYHVIGTDQARTFIHEIITANTLRQKSTLGTAANAVKERTFDLVQAPFETIDSVGQRINAINSLEDALLFAPNTVLDVSGKLINGAAEMAYTGNRILKSAGGTKCPSFGACIKDAGEDVFSGINSVIGKHGAARRLHAQYGTDSETRNPILKHEIDRLSYAHSYTKAGTKFVDVGVSAIDEYARGVDYYNNGGVVINYEDAYRKRDEQIKQLGIRGVNIDLAKAFYKNDSYTKKQRRALISALLSFEPNINLTPFVQSALHANTPYTAKSFTDRYNYMAQLNTKRGIINFTGTTEPIAITSQGHHILIQKADYVDWSDTTKHNIAPLSKLKKSEIHILGHVSPMFKQRAQNHGIRVIEIR